MADPETLNGREFAITITLGDEERAKLEKYVAENCAQAEAAVKLQALRDVFVREVNELATKLPLDPKDIKTGEGLFEPIIVSERERLRHDGQVIYLADHGFNIGGETKLTSEDTDSPTFRLGELAVAAVRPETGFVLAGLEVFSPHDDEWEQNASHELGLVIDPSLPVQTVSGSIVPFEELSEVVAQMSSRLIN